MNGKRKYDIGGGVVIEDDGHYLSAQWRADDGKSSRSIGIRRPPVASLPEQLPAQFSIGGKYFYLPGFAGIHGFWLGVKKWASKEEMQSQQQAGIMGKDGAIFELKAGETYYREVMHFSMWKVEAERELRWVSRDDDSTKDYLSLIQNEDREQEKRFNEVIAPSGRDLKWIVDRIGEWQPLPPEPPPTVLT